MVCIERYNPQTRFLWGVTTFQACEAVRIAEGLGITAVGPAFQNLLPATKGPLTPPRPVAGLEAYGALSELSGLLLQSEEAQ